MKYISRLLQVLCWAISVSGVHVETFNIDTTAVEAVFAQRNEDKAQLDALRNTHMQTFSIFENPAANLGDDPVRSTFHSQYVELARNISCDTAAYIARMLDHITQHMNMPQPCNICCIVFGSLAREEVGFFTDIEMGVLVESKTPAVLRYVHELMQRLSDRIFLLNDHAYYGGTGLRMDGGGNTPPYKRFMHRYSKENPNFSPGSNACGSRLYIATPYEFALHYDAHATQKQFVNTHGTQASGRHNVLAEYLWETYAPLSRAEQKVSQEEIVPHCRNVGYLWGDEQLFKAYMEYREQLLSHETSETRIKRQDVALHTMKQDMKKFSTASGGFFLKETTLPDTIDIKRELYRFPEEMVTSLGFWFRTEGQNCVEILNELYDRNIISKRCFRALKDYFNFVIGLRLRQQWKMQEQLMQSSVSKLPMSMSTYTQQFASIVDRAKRLYKQQKRLEREADFGSQWQRVTRQYHKCLATMKKYRKLKPECSDSILTPEIISAIQERYVPIARKLYRYVGRFIHGEYDVFTRW